MLVSFAFQHSCNAIWKSTVLSLLNVIDNPGRVIAAVSSRTLNKNSHTLLRSLDPSRPRCRTCKNNKSIKIPKYVFLTVLLQKSK